jgi:hypothetical protein
MYVLGFRQQLIPCCLPPISLASRGETGDERERPGAGLEPIGRERNLERARTGYNLQTR